MTNLLIALKNLADNPITDIASHYKAKNRANSMGDALEYYVKDVFCNSHNTDDESIRKKIYHENFSYQGSQNNPPDIIIRSGDAIEVKKIESLKSSLALNSSYPKAKLYSDSPMITKTCRECENWNVKDIIYVVGVAKNNKLKSLWFIYGNCYAADKEIYERIKNKISNGLKELENVQLSETKELGRVNNVDPMEITNLRIRGMWQIKNPLDVFDYATSFDINKELNVNVIMLSEKYLSFPDEDRKNLESLTNENLTIDDIEIYSPNDPTKKLNAKHIWMAK